MSKPPATFLGVRRIAGTAYLLHPEDAVYINILDDPAGRGSSMGIIVSGSIPGMVPEYEMHAARTKAGYTIPEWKSLHYIDRAIEVAMYRIDNKIKAISQEEEAARAKRN